MMARVDEELIGGVVRKRWDDNARLYTEFNDKGSQTLQRAYNTDENARADASVAAQTQADNKAALLARAAQALSGNATFLAIASPTTAQAVVQVKALTKQMNALIKLAVNDLTNTDNT